MVYTKDEKMEIVRWYLDTGKITFPENATHRQKDNIRKRVRYWVGIYKEKGEEGLEPKRKSYSYLDKKRAIERILNGESTYQVAFSLGITDRGTLKKWLNKYRKYGFDAFREYDSQKQRYFNKTLKKEERIKELERELREILDENKQLKVEVTYLKKLIALVQERVQHTKKSVL